MREAFWDHFRTYFFSKKFHFFAPPDFFQVWRHTNSYRGPSKFRCFISRNIRRITRFYLWDLFLIFWGPLSESTLRQTPSIDLPCFPDIPIFGSWTPKFFEVRRHTNPIGAQPKFRASISRNIRRITRFHLWDLFLIFWGPLSESTLRWTPSIELPCFPDIPIFGSWTPKFF